jgi:cell division protein FtsZ
MSFSIEFADDNVSYEARIKVIGVGGSGGNAVNTMISLGLEGVEFVAVNTDAQALNNCLAATKIQIGTNITRGLGAGAEPDRGRKAAMEEGQVLKEILSGTDMVFITAGMGGGTGTGAAPVIAQLARELEILAVGVATKPFAFEGKQRLRRAEAGLTALREQVDTLVTIPNQKLLTLDDDDLTFVEAFQKADEVLYQAVKGISDLITQSGMVNVDFADVKTVMSNMGRALMGTGCAKGDGRARLAAELAVASPLLDNISMDGAMGVLINVVGGPDMRMREVNEAATLIQEQAHEDANIIFGATIDDSMGDTLKVTVIATGFDHGRHEIEVDEEPAQVTVATDAAVELARTSSHSRSANVARPTSVQRPATLRAARSERYEPRSRVTPIELPTTEPDEDIASRYREERQRPARERSYLVAREDIDWDTPAYQRRGGGS